jgi:DNA-binding NarL/FixJ family response regulator
MFAYCDCQYWNGHARKCMVGDDNQRFKFMLDVVGELSKRTAVLVVAELNPGQVDRILQAGARGYVPGSDAYSLDVGTIVHEIAGGRRVIGPVIASTLLQHQRQVQQLSEREIAVLRLLAGGLQPKEIADRLNVVLGTAQYAEWDLRQAGR